MPRFEKGSQEAKDYMAKIRNASKAGDYVPPANKRLTKKQKEREAESKIKVDIPIMGETSLIVPEYFAVPRKGGYKLVNPMSQERNLSSRGGKQSLKVIRKPVGDMVLVREDGAEEPLPLLAFTKKDRTLIQNHFKLVEQFKDRKPEDVPTIGRSKPKERGRPTKLPKNIEVHKERKTKPNWSMKKKDEEEPKKEPKKEAVKPKEPEPEPENISMTMEETPSGYQRKKRQIYASDDEKKEAVRKQKRDFAQRKRDKLKAEKPPKVEGGRIAAPEFKSLIDASYDPKQTQVGDYILDKQLSTGTSKVYHNPATGQVVVAHKGTEGITDWGNNAVYALGGKSAYKMTPRYKEAKKVQKKAEKKYGSQNVSTIGHSQGGLQAELLGGKSKEIITLNKATRPFESNKNKNQFDVRSKGDVVSAANPFGKKTSKDIEIKSGSYNPLTEHSSGVLDKLDDDLMIGQGAKESIEEKINKKRMERDDMMEAYNTASEELDTLYEKMMEGDDDSEMEGDGLKSFKSGSFGSDFVIQSVIFKKDKYSVVEAKKWLKDNKYKSPKVDETDNMLRFRQLSPTDVDKKGYTEYHNKPLGLSGIQLVIAYRRKAEERKGTDFKKRLEGRLKNMSGKGGGQSRGTPLIEQADAGVASLISADMDINDLRNRTGTPTQNNTTIPDTRAFVAPMARSSIYVDDSSPQQMKILAKQIESLKDSIEKVEAELRSQEVKMMASNLRAADSSYGVILIESLVRQYQELKELQKELEILYERNRRVRNASIEGMGSGASRVAPAPPLFDLSSYPLIGVRNETPQMKAIKIKINEKYGFLKEKNKPYSNPTIEALLGGERRAMARELHFEMTRLKEDYDILAAELTPPSSEGSEGSGLKGKRKFAKGSQEAKDFMKSLIDKRKN